MPWLYDGRDTTVRVDPAEFPQLVRSWRRRSFAVRWQGVIREMKRAYGAGHLLASMCSAVLCLVTWVSLCCTGFPLPRRWGDESGTWACCLLVRPMINPHRGLFLAFREPGTGNAVLLVPPCVAGDEGWPGWPSSPGYSETWLWGGVASGCLRNNRNKQKPTRGGPRHRC